MLIKCPQCGKETSDVNEECFHCGCTLRIKCTKCNAKNSILLKKCSGCGYPLRNVWVHKLIEFLSHVYNFLNEKLNRKLPFYMTFFMLALIGIASFFLRQNMIHAEKERLEKHYNQAITYFNEKKYTNVVNILKSMEEYKDSSQKFAVSTLNIAKDEIAQQLNSKSCKNAKNLYDNLASGTFHHYKFHINLIKKEWSDFAEYFNSKYKKCLSSRIHVFININTINSNSQTITILGKTNLPDKSELVISGYIFDNCFRGCSIEHDFYDMKDLGRIEIKNGIFKKTFDRKPFIRSKTQKLLGIQFIPLFQHKSIKEIVGTNGDALDGKLIKEEALGNSKIKFIEILKTL